MSRSRRVAVTLTVAQWELILQSSGEGRPCLHPRQKDALDQAEDDIAAAIAPREGPLFVARGVAVVERFSGQEVATFAYMDNVPKAQKAARDTAKRRNAGGS